MEGRVESLALAEAKKRRKREKVPFEFGAPSGTGPGTGNEAVEAVEPKSCLADVQVGLHMMMIHLDDGVHTYCIVRYKVVL